MRGNLHALLYVYNSFIYVAPPVPLTALDCAGQGVYNRLLLADSVCNALCAHTLLNALFGPVSF